MDGWDKKENRRMHAFLNFSFRLISRLISVTKHKISHEYCLRIVSFYSHVPAKQYDQTSPPLPSGVHGRAPGGDLGRSKDNLYRPTNILRHIFPKIHLGRINGTLFDSNICQEVVFSSLSSFTVHENYLVFRDCA